MPLIIKEGLKEIVIYKRQLEEKVKVAKCGTGREITV